MKPTVAAFSLSAVALLAIVQYAGGNQVFKWKTIEFTDLIREPNSMVDGSVYYNEDNGIITGFDYDVETGYICGAFPRFKSVPVTIACFSANPDDRTTTPKFSPFPTATDNDLPGWPKASDREAVKLGQARGFKSRRRGRGRFGAYYYEEDDDIVSDEERGHGTFRATNDKTKAFTGFSSLGNLFKKKDNKEVVVAVVDDNSGGYGGHHGSSDYHGHQWSSEENRWRPYRKDKDDHDHHNNHEDAYVEQIGDDKDKKNAFFSFFDKFGSRISSVFNKKKVETDKTPVIHINAPSRSSEEEQHYRPTKYRPHNHGPSANWYSSEEDDDDRWHMRPQKKNKKPSRFEYRQNENENQKRNFQSDLRSEAVVDTPVEKATEKAPQIQPDLQAQLQAAVPSLAASSSSSASSEEERPAVKPIRIQRPYNFISVRDTRFDKCGRLWFIDTGATEDPRNAIVYKPPTLWAFEVTTDKMGKLISRPYLRYELEDSSASGLRSLIVDIHADCDDYHVYIPNHKDNRMVVYSSRRGVHWQFNHPTFQPVAKEVDYPLNGELYQLTGGVYSLTMGPRDDDGFRDVFYSPASGTGEYKVNTNLLRDRRAAPNRFNPKFFKSIGYRGEEGWTRGQVYDSRSDVIFFTSGQSIQCWNTNKILTPDTYGTAYTHEDLVHGADIKVDQKGNIWSLSNKLPLIQANGLDKTEYNFNLYRVKPREVVKGTVCAEPQQRRNRALVKEEGASDADKRFDAVAPEEATAAAMEVEKVAEVPVAQQTSEVLLQIEENVPEVASAQIKVVPVVAVQAEEPVIRSFNRAQVKEEGPSDADKRFDSVVPEEAVKVEKVAEVPVAQQTSEVLLQIEENVPEVASAQIKEVPVVAVQAEEPVIVVAAAKDEIIVPTKDQVAN